MNFQAAFSFLVYVLINCFTPGPGNLLAMNTMIRFSWRDGRNLLLGIFAGYYAVQIMCASMVWGLNRYMNPVFSVMRYVGVAYILWLAWHILRSRPDFEENTSKPSFWTGFLLQFVNVKIYLFGITALSGYVVPYYSSFLALFLVEIGIATTGTIASTTWAAMGRAFQKIYLKHFRVINIILALALLECAVSLLLTEL